MTITEVIAAVLILGLGVAGLAATLVNGLDLTRQNANRVVAANLASSEIDDLLTLPFGTESPPTGLLALVGPPEELPPVEVDGRPFTITRHVYWSTNQADLGPCVSPTAEATDENVLRIDVSVTWPRPRAIPPVTSSTSVAPPVDTFDSGGGVIFVFVGDDQNQPVQGVDVNLIGPTETLASTLTGMTDADGCALFEGLSIGSYRAIISRSGYVDIDQRITATPMPSTLDAIGDNDVTSIQGVTARSRATVEFFYTQGHELGADAEGWDGGTLPSGLTWNYANSRGTYEGPEFGSTAPVYPGTFQIFSGFCEVADPESVVTSTDSDGETVQSPRWPDASRDTVIATPAGGQTLDGLVTLGSLDISWDNEVIPDPGRSVTLRAVSADPECDGRSIDLGTTTVGADDLRFALPWGAWSVEAREAGAVVASASVVVSPDDIGVAVPLANLVLAEPVEPGPAGVAGPVMWLDADAPATVTQAPIPSLDTLGVIEWRDRTSFGNDATSAGLLPGNGPRYVDGVLNGRPIMRFDGSSSYLEFDGSFLADTDYTILMVARRTADVGDTTNYVIGGETGGPDDGNLHLGYRTNTQLTHGQWANDYNANVAGWTASEPAHVLTWRLDQSTGKELFRDGVSLASRTDADGRTPLAGFEDARIGRFLDTFFRGDVAEIVIYPRALGASEREAVEAYLEDKWIGTVAPPPGTTPIPPDAITGLQLWLDAGDLSTLHGDANQCSGALGTQGQVGCWRDKSGNDRDATSSGNSRPRYEADSLDGSPGLTFGGRRLLGFDGSFLAASDYTVIVVSRRTDPGNHRYLIGARTNGPNNGHLHLGYRANTTLTHAHWGNDYNVAVDGYETGEPARIHAWALDQSTGRVMFQDGQALATNANATPLGSFEDAQIGRRGNRSFVGQISEVIVYDRALTGPEIDGLHAHLGEKWGVTVVTP